MAPLKRFIRRSLIAHIIVLIVGFIMSMWQHKTNFIVFGAHSRYDAKPTHHTLFAGKRGGGFGGTKKQQVKSGVKSGKKRKAKPTKKAKHQTKKTVPVKKQRTKKQKKSHIQEASPVPEEQEAKPKPKVKRKKKRNAPVDAPIIEKPKQEPDPEPEPEPTPEPEQDTVAPPELETDEPEEVAPPELETEVDDANEPGDEREDNPSEGPGDGFSIEGEDDPAALARYQKHVQHEIDRLWHPPVGVPKNTLCTVQFIIADDGSVASCTFITRSKVLIYDLSIMRIAKQMRFDTSLWGKRFVIGFKQ